MCVCVLGACVCVCMRVCVCVHVWRGHVCVSGCTSLQGLKVMRLDVLSEPLYTSSYREDIAKLATHETKDLPPYGALLSHEVHDIEVHWTQGMSAAMWVGKIC